MSVRLRLCFSLLLLLAGCEMDEPAAPVAKFTVANNNCVGPCQIKFTDASENTSVYSWTYQWDFGDSTSSSEKNPEHIYKTAGNYIVRFTLNGKYGSSVYSDTITIDDKSVLKTVADFKIAEDTLEIYKEISFINTSVHAISYVWNFGDNSSDSVSTLQNPKHTYKNAGKFYVMLTAIGPGTTDVKKDSITIEMPVVTVDFSMAADTTAKDSTKVTFVNKSVHATKYKWDFGNKKISAEKDPPPVWYKRTDKDSTYTVELSAMGATGNPQIKRLPLLIRKK